MLITNCNIARPDPLPLSVDLVPSCCCLRLPRLLRPVGVISARQRGVNREYAVDARAWRHGDELIGLGYALKQLVHARRAPRYLPAPGDGGTPP